MVITVKLTKCHHVSAKCECWLGGGGEGGDLVE
jgi:hypothetical protein